VDDKTGNFKVGKDSDALIVNMNQPGQDRHTRPESEVPLHWR
jgi:cytosine/adenosine deaminase-related metal-dependent hydrolase